ncbi:unnamed protein product [Bemisia tabaci]|uniref:ABC transporter domain-containing protein n=1 Tax=Bemisia tabaci TaxID=7038 RepID=A0A9P0F1Q5_BEMTA|nr:unnamed protein product [Bemisia tabaci]
MTQTRTILMQMPSAIPIDISFKEVTFTVKDGFGKEKKRILKGVSGRFQSGELTAIMGPSGAGKSSLLNVLTGFNTDGMIGSIYTSSRNADKCQRLNRKESCYIMQDDKLCPLFTVYETMKMAADLKLGTSLSEKAKVLVIEDVLETIGLQMCRHTKCGRLSGGQKKRLSIALELIDNPPVMFLDEPTTGLDSISAHQCISMLRGLARGGRTIVCTIHQPSASVYEMFDHVYVIADGLCVYQGSAINTVPYLRNLGLSCPQYHNPADFLLECVTGEYGQFQDELVLAAKDMSWRSLPPAVDINSNTNGTNGLKESMYPIPKKSSKTMVLINPPSEWARFNILFFRSLLQLYRDWTSTHIKIVLHTAVGILLGLLYTNAGIDGSKTISNVGFCIVSLVYLSYTSIMPAILKFPQELHVLKKEQFNNWYQLRTYYLAFLATNVPVQMLFCFIYVSISYYMSSQLMVWSRFLMYLAICELITLLSEGFGLILGTLLSPVNGVFIGSIMTCVAILFAGFLVLFSHMPRVLYYVSFVSYMRYGLEGLVNSVYGFGRGPLECPEMYCHYRLPETAFDEIGMVDGRYWPNVAALTLFLLMVTIASFFSLKKSLRSH